MDVNAKLNINFTSVFFLLEIQYLIVFNSTKNSLAYTLILFLNFKNCTVANL